MTDKPKNECGKTRDVDNPYEVWENAQAGFTWHILKKYQRPDKEAETPTHDGLWQLSRHTPTGHGKWETPMCLKSNNTEYG